ncbi:hypothetical protein [Paludisphaera mucosa]|uniref:Uncharacterized protein n=1 Tax=Paludisphaera mucosa TaxID=3030827 RepID=A0ABT6FEZ5_9BACT|nr:hypothetical protein [Paludisphaera mucosa]MDG3006064.1 hypothetical protein [Paludisphaera mucosa]
MGNLKVARRLLPLVVALVVFAQGCGGDEGGGSGRFVPNENKIEKIDGLSPSEAFHKGERKR